MKKIRFINLIVLLYSIMLICTSVFAFYYFSTSFTSAITSGIDNEVVVPINTELDLRLAAFDTVFQSNSTSNTVQNRKILQLNENIVLTSDLTIEADVNIDFNGHYIDVNGFKLLIRHNYISNVTLFNGSIIGEESGGSFIIDIPNAELVTSNFDCDFMEIVYDFELLKEEIFAFLDSITENYYIADLMLPFSYKHYPLDFSYISSVGDVINEFGHVSRPANDTEVEITLQLTDKNDESNQDTHTVTVMVLSSSSDKSEAGIDIIDRYFSRYAFDGDVFGIYDDDLDQLIESYGFLENDDPYIYFNNITLITSEPYFGLTFKYVVDYPGSYSWAETDIVDGVLPLGAINGIVEVELYVYSSTNLEISLATKTYKLYSYDNYYAARSALNEVGVVALENIYSVIALEDFTFMPNLDSLSIEIINDDDENYEIILDGDNDDKRALQLKALDLPEIDPQALLTYTFTFKNGAPQTVTKNLQIYLYIPSSSGSIGLSGLDKVFYLLLEAFNNELPSIYAFEDFHLPASQSRVRIRYEFIVDTEYVLSKCPEATYATAENIFTEITDLFDFSINTLYVPPVNTPVTVKLYFDGIPYQKYFSFTLPGILANVRPSGYSPEIVDDLIYDTMLGVFDADEDDILKVDEVLYSTETTFTVNGGGEAYTIESLKGLEYLVSVNELSFINVDFDTAFSEFSTYTLKTQLNRLTIQNSDIDANDLTQLGSMFALTYLNLSHNEITDLSKMPSLPKLTSLNLSNNSITSYDNIDALYSIETLTIDKGEVSIEPLKRLNKLSNVYIISGTTTANNPVPMDVAFEPLNHTKYIIMRNSGIMFYYNGVPVEGPSTDQLKYAVILESIFYFNESKTVLLPTKLNCGGATYDLTWSYVSSAGTTVLNGATAVTVNGQNATITNTAGFLTIGNIPDGETLTLIVTVGGSTLMRQIYIYIEHGS